MAGFFPRLTEGGDSTGETRQILIDDSVTMTLGDAVAINTTGALGVVAVGERVLGVVTGFVDKNGLPLNAQHVTGSDFTQSGTAGRIGSETVVTASDNTTDSQIQAVVIVDPSQEYYNDADEDLDLTDDYQYFDTVSAGDQIDASTVSTTGQFLCVDRDPDNDSDASKGIFRIAESALYLG